MLTLAGNDITMNTAITNTLISSLCAEHEQKSMRLFSIKYFILSISKTNPRREQYDVIIFWMPSFTISYDKPRSFICLHTSVRLFDLCLSKDNISVNIIMHYCCNNNNSIYAIVLNILYNAQ